LPEPFQILTSRTLVLEQANIDTDQIIPARFLTTTTREGLGRAAFYDWRYDQDGTPKPDVPLNQIDPTEHRILVAGDNFACGSSREHAPWALYDYGFRVVISSGIADIFVSNALKNGLLTVMVDADTHAGLLASPGATLTVDLQSCELRSGDGRPVSFTIDPFARACLIEGVDSLGWLLGRGPAIRKFEEGMA